MVDFLKKQNLNQFKNNKKAKNKSYLISTTKKNHRFVFLSKIQFYKQYRKYNLDLK
jgi:hypothetical protein